MRGDVMQRVVSLARISAAPEWATVRLSILIKPERLPDH